MPLDGAAVRVCAALSGCRLGGNSYHVCKFNCGARAPFFLFAFHFPQFFLFNYPLGMLKGSSNITRTPLRLRFDQLFAYLGLLILPFRMPRSRNWIFTINNPTEEEESNLCAMPFSGEPGHPIGLAYSHEVAPTTGTPHLQGYMHFANQVMHTTVHELLQRQFYVEIMRGRMEQNEAYCSKAASLIRVGVLPKHNDQNGADEKERWDTIKDLAKSGDLDSIESKVFVQNYRTLVQIRKDYMQPPPNLDDVCGVWIYGPPGVGKSGFVRLCHPDFYEKPLTHWWDGYQGQETVLIEDIDVFNVSLGGHLKRWADRYAFHAEVKGGATIIRPKLIIVTSNHHPREIWHKNVADADAICRRFTIKHLATLIDFSQDPIQPVWSDPLPPLNIPQSSSSSSWVPRN